MFGLTLEDEYRQATDLLNLTPENVKAMHSNAAAAAFDHPA
jgi:hypothetical protein